MATPSASCAHRLLSTLMFLKVLTFLSQEHSSPLRRLFHPILEHHVFPGHCPLRHLTVFIDIK